MIFTGKEKKTGTEGCCRRRRRKQGVAPSVVKEKKTGGVSASVFRFSGDPLDLLFFTLLTCNPRQIRDGLSQEQIDHLINGYANLVNLIDPMKSFRWGKDVSVENLHQGFTHVFESTFETTEGSRRQRRWSAATAVDGGQRWRWTTARGGSG